MLVLQICPEQPVLKQKWHCKEETVRDAIFFPFHLLQKEARGGIHLYFVKEGVPLVCVRGGGKGRTEHCPSAQHLTAVLWFAEKMHCRLPVQLECFWGTQVQEIAFPSFSQALFSDISCHCPSVTPLVIHQGSTSTFAAIDVERAVSSSFLGSLEAEISRGNYVAQN